MTILMIPARTCPKIPGDAPDRTRTVTMNRVKRLALLFVFLPLWLTAWSAPATEGAWEKVRARLFAGRSISEPGSDVIELQAPERAADAATVPIVLRAKQPQRPERFVRKVYLVIDHNPSPVGAVFTFAPESGQATVETRVRIEDYSMMRAIAELSDGSLHMVTRYIKASGGCSAPAGKDAAAAAARLGKTRLQVIELGAPGRPALAQLMISHPNHSGLVMDQLTRLYQPADFVRRVEVSYAGRTVFSADLDFTISENPNFRFFFLPTGDGELRARIEDSHERRFESSLALREGKPAGQ
jgi:sulfur-oxidizing protein SoxY